MGGRVQNWLATRCLPKVLLTVAGLLVVPVSAAQAQTAETAQTALGRELSDWLLHGKYTAARERVASASASRLADQGKSGNDPGQVQWSADDAGLVAEVLILTGDLKAAKAVLQPHVAPAKLKTASLHLLRIHAELLRRTATAESRKQFLMAAVQAQPKQLWLRVLLGEQLRELGKRVEAHRLLDAVVTAYEDKLAEGSGDLVAVAKALQVNGFVKDALQVLEEASEIGANPAEGLAVQLAEGELFLSKYNWRDADNAFKEVLQENPHHARALVGMARIDLASDHNIAKARERVEAVLKTDPTDLDAMALRAEIALWDEDTGKAQELLDQAKAQRPDWLPGLRLQGTVALLRDDNTEWKKLVQHYTKLAPGDGELHLTAANYLEINHRYTEVVDLLRTAVELDGELWQAHAALGMALARMADDKGAEQALTTAFSGDPFDVRTANQLSVLYDDALKHMVLLKGRLIDLRVHKKERPALERTMLPFLQEAVSQLNTAYGFEAKRPLQIEIFPTTQQFSVRTVGLPQLGAHAVCFGHLITSRSPVAEPFNWQMVLTHELAHVYHIQATGGRVPRWLTEGLAMMETAWANPRWVQQNDRRAWDRLQAGKLAKMATFNLAFSQARSMQDILDAYDQAMRQVQFLAERFGRDKVRALVTAHKSGKPTTQLLQEVLGQSADSLDSAFASWLAKDLARFGRDFRPDWPRLGQQFSLPEPMDEDEDAPPAYTLPADASAVRKALLLGLLSWRQGKAEATVQHFDAGVALTPAGDADQIDLCRMRSALMDLAVMAGDRTKAKTHADWLVAQPAGRCDGVEQRQVLAALAKKAGDKAQTWQHIRAGLAIDPKDDGLGKLQLDLLKQVAPAVQGQAPATTGTTAPDVVTPDAKAWQAIVAPAGWSDWRTALLALLQLDAFGGAGAELLATTAWARWPTLTDATAQTEAKADLKLAAGILEEVEPAGRRSVLAEARSLRAHGQLPEAVQVYRLAADRSKSSPERAEVWCEAAEAGLQLAGKAGSAELKEQAQELERRCVAERPVVPKAVPKPAGGVVPVGGM
jgi:tetratricopeptide (TPR) repeat protein